MPKLKTCSLEVRAPLEQELNHLALIPSAAPFLSNRFLILLSAHQLASFLAFRAVAEDEFEILQLETIPAFRRQGFARLLLQRFRTENPGDIFLEVRESNHPARQFYEKEGFISVSIRKQYYSLPCEDAIVLKVCSC